MLSVRHKMQFIILANIADPADRDPLGLHKVREIGIEDFREHSLLVIADDNIHGRIRPERILRVLHVAARCNDDRIRIHLLRPMQHLPRLSVRHIRDSACIDHVKISPRRKGNFLITGGQQALPHSVGLV